MVQHPFCGLEKHFMMSAVWEDGFALYLSLQTSPFQPHPLWKPHVLFVLFSCRGAGWNSETLGLNKTGNSWKKSPGLFRGVLPVDLFVESKIHPYLPASENLYRFTHQLSNYSDKPRFKWNPWNKSDLGISESGRKILRVSERWARCNILHGELCPGPCPGCVRGKRKTKPKPPEGVICAYSWFLALELLFVLLQES